MRYLVAAAITATLVGAQAVWPTPCVSGAGLSYWNQTRCPQTATCMQSHFSGTGYGCCPMPNAVTCSAYVCCPANTTCQSSSGSGYDEIWQCVANGSPVGLGTSICKPGPIRPYSTTLKNVLVIGDSLSIGYTPWVATALSDIALVQHAPYDFSDGGAEDTSYSINCLPFFLASPSGLDIAPDVLLFNWGMHDGPMGNTTIPGQNGPATAYAGQLQQLVSTLLAWSAKHGTKMMFVTTTPFLCNVTANGCSQTLNNQAAAIMASAGIPIIDTYDAIVAKCGPAPVQSCFGSNGCWCPHCSPGYAWLANSTIAPAVRAALLA